MLCEVLRDKRDERLFPEKEVRRSRCFDLDFRLRSSNQQAEEMDGRSIRKCKSDALSTAARWKVRGCCDKSVLMRLSLWARNLLDLDVLIFVVVAVVDFDFDLGELLSKQQELTVPTR